MVTRRDTADGRRQNFASHRSQIRWVRQDLRLLPRLGVNPVIVDASGMDRQHRHLPYRPAGISNFPIAVGLRQGYRMLRRPNPERHQTRSFRVDVPFLCVRVVVRVNLQFCAVNVNSAVLDIEYRADLSRERPAVAFPCTRQSEAFRRY